jgi:CBS domain-containing protein
MLERVVSISPQHTIGEALTVLQSANIRRAPVVDAEDILLGHFELAKVLAKLLPEPLALGSQGLMGAHMRLDYMLDSDSDIANQLRSLLAVPVLDVMEENRVLVHPTTPLLEGIRLLVEHGGPVPVVQAQDNKLVGLISLQSAIKVLLDAFGVSPPDDAGAG